MGRKSAFSANRIWRGVGGILENSSSLLHNSPMILTIFSIFVANRLASLVEIEFSEVYIFVITFLLLSNLWGYAARGLTAIRNKYYPVVDITRVPRKPILLSILIFVLLAVAYWAVGYVLELLVSGSK